MDFQLPDYNLLMMLPEIVLFVWALAVVAFDVITHRKAGSAAAYFAMAGLVVSGVLLALVGQGRGFGNMFDNDSMAIFFKVIFLGAAFMTIGSSFGIIKDRIVNHRGEFFGLILFSTLGMMFLASASELLSLYIGLELTTIPLFVLAAFYKDDKRSIEAGIKYLVVGALSSALLLYGLSFLYGLSGTTDILSMNYNLTALETARSGGIGVILILAIVAIVAGVGFKLALPPFHQWAPDVYEGSPTPITAFLSVGSKAAGLVAFAKILVLGLFRYYGSDMSPNDWGLMVGVLAAASLIIGNVVAIRQTNIKRMLAYSSIAHAGYVMLGMLSMNELGLASVGFYMFAYLFTNMGVVAIVAHHEDKTGSCEISSYASLSKTSPFMAHSMSVFLLSLIGIPPLAGFFSKYYVFASAIKQAGSGDGLSWMYWLVGIGLITSVFALYYYANVIRTMYFEANDNPAKLGFSIPVVSMIVICLIGVFVVGLNPEPIIRFASGIPLSYGFILP